MKTYNVVILGATGAVGRAFLNILEERDFPIEALYCLASSRSAGKTVKFKGQTITIQDAATFDFNQAQIGLFSAGGQVSAEYAPRAATAGCVVIDNTSHFRNDANVPLVVPEVNPHALMHYQQSNIIANPNCSTIQMLVALKPLHDHAVIERINVATYQAVSGSGQSAIKELHNQSAALLESQPVTSMVYPVPIAFNVIPQIDAFQANGYTREEMKMVWETQKILEDDQVLVNPTAVRVPVVYGHAEAIHIETKTKLTAAKAHELLQQAPGVQLLDDPKALQYPTPLLNADGSDPVYVGRVREDISHPRGLDLWVVSDNVRKGAALNAIQIAEMLVSQYL